MNTINPTPSRFISAFLTLILSPVLHAQVLLVSPVSKWLPALNTITKAYVFEMEKFSVLNLKIPEGSVESTDVDLTGRFQISNLSPDMSTNQFNMEIGLQNAEVLAKNVRIQISMKQDLGFGSATVNLNVQCAAISLQILSLEKLFAKVNRDFQVIELTNNLTKDSVKTNLIGCTQISGLDSAIQEKVISFIQAQMLNSQFLHYISNEISLQLNKKLEELAKNFLNTDEGSGSIKLGIDEKFQLRVTITNPLFNEFSADELAAVSEINSTTLLIKKAYLEKVTRDQLNVEISNRPLTSKMNAGLRKLTCSRWAQFFSWPALSALPKCFDLQVVSKLENVKLVDPAHMKFNFDLKSWAKAVDVKKDLAFFRTASSVDFSAMKSNVNFLEAHPFPEFLSWSGKSSRISSGIFKAALETYLSEELTKLKSNQVKLKLFNFFDIQKSKFISPDTVLVQLKND